MNSVPKPIYLLADSQLLFWKEDGNLFLESIKIILNNDHPKAAYIGASNGNLPEFYDMFVEAMTQVGIVDCRMIASLSSEEDAQFIEQADLILLAGGDIATGWKIFDATDFSSVLRRRYAEGALLIGVSAGAVQLGSYGWIEKGQSYRELFKTFNLVPLLIDVHDEREEWRRLQEITGLLNPEVRSIGIPSGAGIIYHPDHTLEPVRYQAMEYLLNADGKINVHVLLPPL
jgi:cyanophycinase-like exopeptidase